MNIIEEVKQDVLVALGKYRALTEDLILEYSKNNRNGDLSTNVAMALANKAGCKPSDIADEIKSHMLALDYVEKVETGGAGFVNITLKKSYWHKCLVRLLDLGLEYGRPTPDKTLRINVEYVSANPTGPCHVGHSRGAQFGDVVSRMFEFAKHDVTREFYINDHGNQIEILVNTLFIRYQQIINQNVQDIPEGLYPGGYMIDSAKRFRDKFGDSVTHHDQAKMRDFVVQDMLELIKSDLNRMGVVHDVFFSEQTLHNTHQVEQAVKSLEHHVYYGITDKPKGDAQEWEQKNILLFRTTDFGDDQDRSLQRADGDWSYFASEVAYIKNKIDRGFDKMIIVLGADHIGYVKRLEAAAKVFGANDCSIKICQLVNYIQNGKQLKMSKRSGDFVTIGDVLDLVGKDSLRFMMLMRKHDVMLDFDLEQVKEASKNNPVFYVQYAHVRCCSVLSNAQHHAPEAFGIYQNKQYNLELLSTQEEVDLIKLLTMWPVVFNLSLSNIEPHRLAYYMHDLASRFHGLWNFCKDQSQYKFINQDDAHLTAARLALVKGVSNVLRICSDIIGITALEKM